MLTILITSDHRSSREALARTLSAQPPFRVVAVCADAHAALTITTREQPDIVLIDGSSDPLMAIEATKKILSASGANVIAISRQTDKGFAHHMLAAGALGYLTSQSTAAEVVAAIMSVAKDDVFICEALRREDHVPQLPTPEKTRFSFKQSVAALRENARKRIAEPAEIHWHAILKFTN